MFAQKEWSGVIRCAGLILPATALGMLAMVSGGVSPVIWGQQTAAFFVFACLAKLLKRAFRKIPVAMRAAALALILAATLLGVEAGGAKRWLDLGVFTVNAAMMVLPALLILISGMECPWPVMLCVMAVLSFQPDLSLLHFLRHPQHQGNCLSWRRFLLRCFLFCGGIENGGFGAQRAFS